MAKKKFNFEKECYSSIYEDGTKKKSDFHALPSFQPSPPPHPTHSNWILSNKWGATRRLCTHGKDTHSALKEEKKLPKCELDELHFCKPKETDLGIVDYGLLGPYNMDYLVQTAEFRLGIIWRVGVGIKKLSLGERWLPRFF